MSRASVAAVLVLVAGCGVPAQDDPTRIDAGSVPSRLRESAGPESAAPSSTDPSKTSVVVHFVRDARLAGVRREVPRASTTEQLDAVLGALGTGPDETEQTRGLSTALPAELEVRAVGAEGGQATLALDGEAVGRSATENVLAVAQIVLSVTSLPAIDSVQLTRDGRPVEALLADGSLTAAPLKASDYASLRAR